MRIHPAESRIRKLAAESPSNYFAFDILYAKGKLVKDLPIERRREKLESFFASAGDHELLQLSPATTDRVLAGQWFNKFGSAGLDGVIAKRLGVPYHSGDREGMIKVKHLKTADCVVGGFRYGEGTKVVGSLLLGYSRSQVTGRRSRGGFALKPPRPATCDLRPHPVRPELVCEVEYDHALSSPFKG